MFACVENKKIFIKTLKERKRCKLLVKWEIFKKRLMFGGRKVLYWSPFGLVISILVPTLKIFIKLPYVILVFLVYAIKNSWRTSSG